MCYWQINKDSVDLLLERIIINTSVTLSSKSDQSKSSIGDEMYELETRLFPICRSITGDGVRQTFDELKKIIPIQTYEVPSGSKAFDWEIPPEWNIKDAYIKDKSGVKIVDFQKNNLHVVGYSTPFKGEIPLTELKEHLYSLPDQPDLIPYITSYYSRRWGFCLTHNQLQTLKDDVYEVNIDSTLEPGFLTYGDLLIKGKSEKEIVISTYICHPSMANNELSGPVIATYLAKQLLNKTALQYSYRFIFVPETIGSIVYLSKHLESLRKKTIAGYVITCAGDNNPFSYLFTPGGEELVDRATIHVLKNSDVQYKTYDFLTRGSDERQYCSPGVNLPFGSLMRSKYTEYPEYHTSGDDLNFVSPEGLAGSLEMYQRCFEVLESNVVYQVTVCCEPQLGKRGLYPTLSTKESTLKVRTMTNFIAFCNGKRDLIEIAERINKPIWELFPIVDKLLKNGLIKKIR